MSYQPPIAAEAAKYRMLRSQLIEQHGLDEDDEALLTTLDGETDIIDQLAAMLRRAKELDHFAGMVASQQKELAERKSSLESKADKLRRVVIYFMGLIGRKRVEAPDFAYTLANGRKTLVGECDPSTLPDKFVRIKRTENRAAIKEALEFGELVEGYSLSNGPPHLRQTP